MAHVQVAPSSAIVRHNRKVRGKTTRESAIPGCFPSHLLLLFMFRSCRRSVPKKDVSLERRRDMPSGHGLRNLNIGRERISYCLHDLNNLLSKERTEDPQTIYIRKR